MPPVTAGCPDAAAACHWQAGPGTPSRMMRKTTRIMRMAAGLMTQTELWLLTSTCVTERKHSDSLKKKERNTNNHAASFGYSILKNNGRELGARSMMQDIAGTLC